MDHLEDEPEENEDGAAAPAGRRAWLGWTVMLALGLAVYEITARPRWGVAVGLSRMLWNDLEIGVWWWRRDPWKQRGVCGLVLTSIRATAKYGFSLLFAVFLLSLFLRQQLNVMRDMAEFTMIVAGLAITVWIFGGMFVTILALVGGVRLWIDRSYFVSMRNDEFPPACRYWNQCILLLAGSRIFELIVMFCFFVMISMERLKLDGKFVLAITAAGMIAVLMSQIWVTDRIVARTSSHCWNPSFGK